MKPASSEARKETQRAISLGLAEAADWNLRKDLRFQNVFGHGGDHFRIDVAGCDYVTRNAFGCTFQGHGLRKAEQAGLGGGIVGLTELTFATIDRRNRNDAAEIARAHALYDEPRQVEDRVRLVLDHRFPVFRESCGAGRHRG